MYTFKEIYLLFLTRGLNRSCKKSICAAKDSGNIKAKGNGEEFGGGEVVINGTFSLTWFKTSPSRNILKLTSWF